MKAGFVNIFGKPNAGKSTLLNLLIGEKLAIVSPKVQTTRHRIKGILTTEEYQIIFSDTPGIIDPRYKLQEKMMKTVSTALEDADVALLLVDITEDWMTADELFSQLKLSVPAIVVGNKIDLVDEKVKKEFVNFFSAKKYQNNVILVSAAKAKGDNELTNAIVALLPVSEPFYGEDELTDLPTRFFVAELIREKIFSLFQDEVPYQATVLTTEFKQKSTLIKITAEIIVQRESQKAIILGEGGKMIKKIGTESRKTIEEFLNEKVFLELFVKVRPKWRDNETFLREYGY